MDGIDGIIAGNMAIIFLFVGYFISPFGYTNNNTFRILILELMPSKVLWVM